MSSARPACSSPTPPTPFPPEVNKDDGCNCPDGFKGDGKHKCEDIDECKKKTASVNAKNANEKNTWGSYECGCSGGLLYMKEHDTCIIQTLKVATVLNIDMNLTQVMLMPLVLKQNGASEAGWGFLWVVFFGLVAAGIAGYAVYKYRIRIHGLRDPCHHFSVHAPGQPRRCPEPFSSY